MAERQGSVPTETGPRLVGREMETAVIDRLVADRSTAACAVVVEGDAGTGKTSLWRLGCALAASSGTRLLTARPAEGEVDLPLAALTDLVGDAAAGVGGSVPDGTEFDVVRLGRALVGHLAELAADRLVVVAIDDVQWLDEPSSRVLEFAVRRVVDLPVRLLLTRRSAADAELPLGVTGALLPDRVQRLRLSGLDVGGVGELLRTRLDVRLPRPVLVELQRVTNGNPLFVLELVESARRNGRPPETAASAVPGRLADVFRPGVDQLSGDARRALLVAAAAGVATAEAVEAAAGGVHGVREALDRGWLELDEGRLRPRHPLLGSAVYGDALPGERRLAHRRLADAVTDPVERVRHLAHAAIEPDAGLAGELEAGARLAAARGSPQLGASLASHAVRLTPGGDVPTTRRRRLLGAELQVRAGDPATARKTLESLCDEVKPGRERARLLLLLADTIGDDLAASIGLADEALAEAVGDPGLVAEAHTALGVYRWLAGDLSGSSEHTRASIEAAEASGDEQLVAVAIGEWSHAEAVLGRAWSVTAMDRALEIEGRGAEFPPWLRPSFQLGVILMYTDRVEEARPLIAAELERTLVAGDEQARVGVLFRLAELELRSGNWGMAAEAAAEAATLGRQAGIEQEQAVGEMIDSVVRAHVGDLDGAGMAGRRALALAEAMGDRIVAVRARGALGLMELTAGRPDEALAWLEPARAEQRVMGIGEMSIAAVPEQMIDALVAVGRHDDALAVAEELAATGRPTGRAWHAAVAARGRALVASERGEHAVAMAALEDAYAAHERLANPFTLGRTHLAAGIVARRARRWADGRRRFNDSLDVFDRLGAARWADRAATELGRLPGRRPAGGELTPTERAVADLVADGLSNKAIAARLSVTTRTVEQRLSSVYRKLGVGSRTQLARAITAPR